MVEAMGVGVTFEASRSNRGRRRLPICSWKTALNFQPQVLVYWCYQLGISSEISHKAVKFFFFFLHGRGCEVWVWVYFIYCIMLLPNSILVLDAKMLVLKRQGLLRENEFCFYFFNYSSLGRGLKSILLAGWVYKEPGNTKYMVSGE